MYLTLLRFHKEILIYIKNAFQYFLSSQFLEATYIFDLIVKYIFFPNSKTEEHSAFEGKIIPYIFFTGILRTLRISASEQSFLSQPLKNKIKLKNQSLISLTFVWQLRKAWASVSFSKCRVCGGDSRIGQDTKPSAPQGVFSHIVGSSQYVPCYSVANKTPDISQHHKD